MPGIFMLIVGGIALGWTAFFVTRKK